MYNSAGTVLNGYHYVFVLSCVPGSAESNETTDSPHKTSHAASRAPTRHSAATGTSKQLTNQQRQATQPKATHGNFPAIGAPPPSRRSNQALSPHLQDTHTNSVTAPSGTVTCSSSDHPTPIQANTGAEAAHPSPAQELQGSSPSPPPQAAPGQQPASTHTHPHTPW